MFSKLFKRQIAEPTPEEQNREAVKPGDNSSSDNMVLRTEDLVKKYRQRTVVNHVSIDVTQGEIVGLLGPNGAGKTTTFYMTTGLITPNQGHIYLNDLDITDYPVYKRAQIGIGYLAQEASVFRKLSASQDAKSPGITRYRGLHICQLTVTAQNLCRCYFSIARIMAL